MNYIAEIQISEKGASETDGEDLEDLVFYNPFISGPDISNVDKTKRKELLRKAAYPSPSPSPKKSAKLNHLEPRFFDLDDQETQCIHLRESEHGSSETEEEEEDQGPNPLFGARNVTTRKGRSEKLKNKDISSTDRKKNRNEMHPNLRNFVSSDNSRKSLSSVSSSRHYTKKKDSKRARSEKNKFNTAQNWGKTTESLEKLMPTPMEIDSDD